MARKNSRVPTEELLQHVQKQCRTAEQYYFGKHYDLSSEICGCDDSPIAYLMPLNSKLHLFWHKNVGPVHAAVVLPAQVLFSFSKLRTVAFGVDGNSPTSTTCQTAHPVHSQKTYTTRGAHPSILEVQPPFPAFTLHAETLQVQVLKEQSRFSL